MCRYREQNDSSTCALFGDSSSQLDHEEGRVRFGETELARHFCDDTAGLVNLEPLPTSQHVVFAINVRFCSRVGRHYAYFTAAYANDRVAVIEWESPVVFSRNNDLSMAIGESVFPVDGSSNQSV